MGMNWVLSQKKSILIPFQKKKYINFRSLHNILRPFLWRELNSIQEEQLNEGMLREETPEKRE